MLHHAPTTSTHIKWRLGAKRNHRWTNSTAIAPALCGGGRVGTALRHLHPITVDDQCEDWQERHTAFICGTPRQRHLPTKLRHHHESVAAHATSSVVQGRPHTCTSCQCQRHGLNGSDPSSPHPRAAARGPLRACQLQSSRVGSVSSAGAGVNIAQGGQGRFIHPLGSGLNVWHRQEQTVSSSISHPTAHGRTAMRTYLSGCCLACRDP